MIKGLKVLHDWISTLASYSISGVPLWVIILGGGIGLFIDADHFIAYYFLGGIYPRFGHIYVFMAVCFMGSIGLAFLGGLLLKMVLTR